MAQETSFNALSLTKTFPNNNNNNHYIFNVELHMNSLFPEKLLIHNKHPIVCEGTIYPSKIINVQNIKMGAANFHL